MGAISADNPQLEYRNEYDTFRDVYYKGKKFTGTVCEGQTLSERTDYVDGLAHGDYFCLYPNGNVHTQARFECGEEIESRSFYLSGKTLSLSDRRRSRLWSEKGALVDDYDLVSDVRQVYYPDGSLHWRRDRAESVYYNRFREAVIILRRASTHYDDALLSACYAEFLGRLFCAPELANALEAFEKSRRHLIWLWTWRRFERDSNGYFFMMSELLTHAEEEVRDSAASIIAIHRFEPYIAVENAQNADGWRRVRMHRAYQDAHFPERDYKRVPS